ncbi:hypothetical protein PJ311_14060 [Bacillus sp. CLL-7-23]|uniref:Uncharacterized protein n=1 Tax=Bacillus changyiensis TaxID=3004103 RepID=A0ABT4X5Y8_9BACI|nr:hypothetical protein [Bacillus changyiensis]MDA7027708.1 hypothetical protein [Bacillus changyiensis]
MTTKTSNVEVSGIDESEELIHMKLYYAKYNKSKGTVTITCKTNIQDRTKIEFGLYEKSEEKKFLGRAVVKDGKVSLEVRDSDFIKNGKFEIEGGCVSSVEDEGYVVHFDHLGKTK